MFIIRFQIIIGRGDVRPRIIFFILFDIELVKLTNVGNKNYEGAVNKEYWFRQYWLCGEN